MMKRMIAPACALLLVAAWTAVGSGSAGLRPASAAPEVTLKGLVMCSKQIAPEPKPEDCNSLVLYAFEGTPEVRAALDEIMAKHYPDGGWTVEQARSVMAQFDAHLRYWIPPGPVTKQYHNQVEWVAVPTAVTGVVSEHDGKMWITPSKLAPATFTYPAKMLAPDRPRVTPQGKPLMLKISDTLLLKSILLPAGRYLRGSPFYQPRFQDEYPHEVVLTKPFYMAEHPITQEMYQAVMGRNPSKQINPKYPVEQAPYGDIEEFCRRLSRLNGLTVRLPTDGEWEYAARVGTSNPCFTEKYRDQLSRAGSLQGDPAPVKTKQPNAWGLYDMMSTGWELVSDWKWDNVRVEQVDPKGPPVTEAAQYGNGPLHKAKGGEYYNDYRPNMHGAIDNDGHCAEGNAIFRIVVEPKPPLD